jgi:hypothetical protein
MSRPSDAAIRMWYFMRIPNVGDMINPSIVSQVSGRPTLRANGADQARLWAIGSILGAAPPNAIVWGSGFMDPDQRPALDSRNLYALRGKLTAGELRRAGLGLAELPLGDPGYLVPDLFPDPAPEKEYKLGFIPHYVDRQHPFFQQILREEGVVDLDVQASPEVFFAQLRKCEAVVSSSLHGLIFAEAFGIPNLWVKLSDRVVRSGFKFRDWFSTMARPQTEPLEPSSDLAGKDLVARAALHDSQIDRQALRSAFPSSRLDELAEPVPAPFVPLQACRERPTPIFVISYNRGKFLQSAVSSYRKLNRKTAIIVHDNGSDDRETLDILDRLEEEGCLIHRGARIQSAEELNAVDGTVQSYFSNWSEPSRYVVTDCDIDLSIAHAGALDLYDELLNRFTDVECVGPMLRIRDIPRTYPLFDRVMERHISQFWSRKPEWTETSFGRVATLDCPIDTTFALHRAGEAFRRLKRSRRVYFPFEARHLDWYLDSDGMQAAPYYSTAAEDISHWSNLASHRNGTREQEGRSEFVYVDYDSGGQRLVEKVWRGE